jgi:DNA-binding NarL/FixJ family response regulator
MIMVLLADDHKMVREGLRYILQEAGDIQIAAMVSNGQEAVEHSLTECPDVAVLDVSMPVMNGLEAARQIHANCPHTCIVMLSMYETANYIQGALNAGALGYVLKDGAGNELVEAVRAVHGGTRYFSPTIAEIVKRL